MYSASAFAANTFVRSALAAAFPLFTVQMFGKVRFSLLGYALPEFLISLLLLVGCELGMYLDRSGLPSIRALPLPVLQVWGSYSDSKQVCTMHSMCL
jgi:hypothetical protein